MTWLPSRSELERLDREDPLAARRDDFVLRPGLVYLDGNSLGALPKRTAQRLQTAVAEEWGEGLITGWNRHGWIDLPARVGGRLARLIGAGEDEVIAGDSISVNLFKLMGAALALRPKRRVILADRRNFPTDLYIAEAAAAWLGRDLQLRLVETPEELAAAVDETTAVMMASHVDYRSGRILDMAGLTRAAHAQGALVIWDLAHSAGALELDLAGSGVDLAVGCGYKYLNGGPGAPAFLYVARGHQEAVRQPLAGWFGHAAPFRFEPGYRPAPGITRFQAGTPPVLGLAAFEASLEVFDGVAMAEARRQSMALTEAFINLVEARLEGFGFTLVSPREAACRGSQASFAHAGAYPIMQALIAHDVIGDCREPDLLRFGFAPLYNRFSDVIDAVDRLEAIMREERWRDPVYQQRQRVI